MGISDLLEIIDRYKKATWKGKISIWFIILIGILGISYHLLKEADSAIELNNKYNVTNNIIDVMHMQVMTTTDAALLILAVIITLVIASIICAICLLYGFNKSRKFILIDAAYKTLKEDYEKIDKENQILKGEYYIKGNPFHLKSEWEDTDLKKQTLGDRIKKRMISNEELYKLAHDHDD